MTDSSRNDRMSAVKIIMINAGVLLVLIISSNLILAIAFEARRYFNIGFEDRRGALPNYNGKAWARKHFEEFANLKDNFHSYYGWRRRHFTGETINIDTSGLRYTPSGGDGGRFGFFGGSSMWGTGVRDDETIPALVADYLGVEAVNYGETAWRSHQSLNRLMEAYIAQEVFDVIVFYDGVNEVADGCRSELAPFSHGRGLLIAKMLEDTSGGIRSFFAPTIKIANGVSRRLRLKKASPRAMFDCSRDSAKSAYIARMLAADWEIAHFIAGRMGARFIGVLQPVAYLSDTPLDYLDLDKDDPLRAEYRAAYPLIRSELEHISERDGLEYIDMTDALDTNEKVYIDFFHLSPNGNIIIASRISKYLQD